MQTGTNLKLLIAVYQYKRAHTHTQTHMRTHRKINSTALHVYSTDHYAWSLGGPGDHHRTYCVSMVLAYASPTPTITLPCNSFHE